MSNYVIPRFPNASDHRRSRVAAGQSPKPAEAAAAGLPNTWFGVELPSRDEMVGIVRIIGDGGYSFQIIEGAVPRAHQGRGSRARIVRTLVDHPREHALPPADVTCLADGTTGRL